MNKENINLSTALQHWGADSFHSMLIRDIMALSANSLPLQQGLSQGDMAAEKPEKVSVMASNETKSQIIVRLGVYFTEIISGCSCGDDPGMLNGYCEMELVIDKLSGDANFRVTG